MNKNKRDLTLDRKLTIYKDRLQYPDMSDKSFSEKHGISLKDLYAIENLAGYNGGEVITRKLNSIIGKELDVLQNISEMNDRFVKKVMRKDRIIREDIDTMDRISNSIIKRASLLEKTSNNNENRILKRTELAFKQKDTAREIVNDKTEDKEERVITFEL